LSLILLIVVAAAVPFGLRALNRLDETSRLSPSYVPAAIGPRERRPFLAEAVDRLRETNPRYVVIGDSMAGSRVHHRRLMELAGAPVVPIFEPASGSVFWYLAFKNWVVASGNRPKAVIFFFRDENLTDPMFRLKPEALDRAAREREPEIDAILAAHVQGPFFRLHGLARGAYGFDRTRQWAEPLIAAAPVTLAAGREWRERLLTRINSQIFTLDALRPTAAADMAFGDPGKFDFDKNLPISVLPAILRTAREAGIRPAFVRVQRRPVDGRPPDQSPALQRYVDKLRRYLEANGAYFHDEWGDPALPLSLYSDGDHIGREHLLHSTELFYRRNRALFQ